MTRGTLAILALCAGLTACSAIRESRINPFNWFGRDRSEQAEVTDEAFIRDPRQFVREVLSVKVEPTPEGAIITAVGLPPVQGFWNAELLPAPGEDPSRLILEFRVAPPEFRTRQGTQQSREIITGLAVSNRALESLREIVVIGQQNRRSVRR